MHAHACDYFIFVFQELGLQSQFASLSKKIELDPEVTEDGTLELYVHFNK